MSEKLSHREAAEKMARKIQDESRGRVSPERAKQIAQDAARRTDHRERERRDRG